MSDNPLVFISYAREDVAAARRLYADLKAAGMTPWMDEFNLRAGQRWRVGIRHAIRDCRYFIALLSSKSASRKGYVHKEIAEALDILDLFPDSEVFLIPVRLDDCRISHEKLYDLNWVDLFPSWEQGVNSIVKNIAPTSSANDVRISAPSQTVILIPIPSDSRIITGDMIVLGGNYIDGTRFAFEAAMMLRASSPGDLVSFECVLYRERNVTKYPPGKSMDDYTPEGWAELPTGPVRDYAWNRTPARLSGAYGIYGGGSTSPIGVSDPMIVINGQDVPLRSDFVTLLKPSRSRTGGDRTLRASVQPRLSRRSAGRLHLSRDDSMPSPLPRIGCAGPRGNELGA